MFEARKNEHGVWGVHFGRLVVKMIGDGKRAAHAAARQLNADSAAVEQASICEAAIRGDVGKLWHLAAGAVVAAKRGEPSDLEALGSLLWQRVKDL